MVGRDFSKTVAVGMDLGSFNARVGTYDTNLKHATVCANHDGHHQTRVYDPELPSPPSNASANSLESLEAMERFYEQRLLQLASDTAHTKDLLVVTSLPNDPAILEKRPEGWLDSLNKHGSVITEAAAVCLAYGVDPETTSKALVLDGGASGLKATLLSSNGGGMWTQNHFEQLPTVNGRTLVEPLAQAVAQQFEQKCRFPRGEVWESKKAKAKLQKACEQSLSTFQRNNNVAIHVDGLYEGMDCNVNISKPKWEHLSSKLANQVKAFCQQLVPHLENPQAAEGKKTVVLIAGNLHDWMTPIIRGIMGADKILPRPSGLDPSEAVAVGCTIQSHLNLEQLQSSTTSIDDDSHKALTHMLPSMEVQCCPVAIGLETANGGSPTTTLIPSGSPLPCMVTHNLGEDASLEIVQLEPDATTKKKSLITLEELEASSTLQLQLSVGGRLRIWVNGEAIAVLG